MAAVTRAPQSAILGLGRGEKPAGAEAPLQKFQPVQAVEGTVDRIPGSPRIEVNLGGCCCARLGVGVKYKRNQITNVAVRVVYAIPIT